MTVCQIGFSSDLINEYAAKMTAYTDGIRLMSVKVEGVNMIENGVIPKMSQEEHNQLIKELEEINEYREETAQCVLDISKNVADHFVEEDIVALMSANKASRGDWSSDESSVDPPSDASTDKELWGINNDRSSIASISSNIVMEDDTKETSLIDVTNPDENNDSVIADDDTSASRKVAGNLTSKNILNFLKEIRGLIKCPMTHMDMIDSLMGTDRISYERDVSQWLREK